MVEKSAGYFRSENSTTILVTRSKQRVGRSSRSGARFLNPRKVDALVAKQIVQRFENFEVVTISSSIIFAAIDCSITAQISFWDALIVIAAEISKCEFIWTEDLNSSQVIRGIRILNPLK